MSVKTGSQTFVSRVVNLFRTMNEIKIFPNPFIMAYRIYLLKKMVLPLFTRLGSVKLLSIFFLLSDIWSVKWNLIFPNFKGLVLGCNDVPDTILSKIKENLSEKSLCYALSEKDGFFLFPTVPSGNYVLVSVSGVEYISSWRYIYHERTFQSYFCKHCHINFEAFSGLY